MEKTGRIQILRHMRNLFLFILLSASSVWARGTFSQEIQVKLNVKNGTIESVFDQIRQQSQFEFFYNTEVLDVKQRVELSVREGSLDEILKEILGTKYSYSIKDRYILITEKKIVPPGDVEMIVIKGSVKDVKGSPLPGVTVLLKGTSIGVSTDHNGEFVLKIPQHKPMILQFSFIGMETKEIPWKGEEMLQVVLNDNVAEMDEVVVTGYQTVKKTRMTGAVEVITAKEIANKGGIKELEYVENQYDFKELPVVVATKQEGNRGDKEGLTLRKAELDSVTADYHGALKAFDEDHHQIRREIEEGIDYEEIDPELEDNPEI